MRKLHLVTAHEGTATRECRGHKLDVDVGVDANVDEMGMRKVARRYLLGLESFFFRDARPSHAVSMSSLSLSMELELEADSMAWRCVWRRRSTKRKAERE